MTAAEIVNLLLHIGPNANQFSSEEIATTILPDSKPSFGPPSISHMSSSNFFHYEPEEAPAFFLISSGSANNSTHIDPKLFTIMNSREKTSFRLLIDDLFELLAFSVTFLQRLFSNSTKKGVLLQ